MVKVPDISFTNSLKPRKGRLLLSDPFLNDEHFERSVVLLCEHTKEGSFGFVLNHLVEVNLNELNDQFPDYNTMISIGGPVDKDVMYFLHTLGNELQNSVEIIEGLYVGGDFEELYDKINLGHLETDQIRFFLGYSGWGKGQLNEELKENAWVVIEESNPDEILTTKSEDLWKHFMNKNGGKFKLISNFPLDPNDN